MIDFSSTRRSFSDQDQSLDVSSLPSNPFDLCRNWLQKVQEMNLLDGNAMTLSTASKTGIVSARTVLLKYFDHRGFIFFTNYESQKAKDLSENPHAAITFYWPSLNRQLLAQGIVSKLPQKESKEYFDARPRLNQLFAHASNQDQIIDSIDAVKQKAEEIDQKYSDQPLPLPDYWGGFVLKPTTFEFWQGGPGRLNIRFKYTQKNQLWAVYQLSP